MRRIRKGDEIVVLAGRDKGKRGTVTRVIASADRRPEYVVVENINMRIRHVRPNPQANNPGGRVPFEAKIHVSNVAAYNSESKRKDRIRIVTDEQGARLRVFASDGRSVA